MTYTNEQVLTVARDIVAEFGEDYVYPNLADGCSYTNEEGSPSCIVGHIVSRLDPGAFSRIIELETPSDEYTVRAYFSWSALHMNDTVGTDFTESQQIALSGAQKEQDTGNTWGEALSALTNLLMKEV